MRKLTLSLLFNSIVNLESGFAKHAGVVSVVAEELNDERSRLRDCARKNINKFYHSSYHLSYPYIHLDMINLSAPT